MKSGQKTAVVHYTNSIFVIMVVGRDSKVSLFLVKD